ncbi:hypothetical protein COO60DRAFT_1509913 [Scenedesmus sp. NREL 46B-D3]|nr:hypothetical protein COO60DRAFT_1509913 [Scenedesmus sp. NREL 46B-D3]
MSSSRHWLSCGGLGGLPVYCMLVPCPLTCPLQCSSGILGDGSVPGQLRQSVVPACLVGLCCTAGWVVVQTL